MRRRRFILYPDWNRLANPGPWLARNCGPAARRAASAAAAAARGDRPRSFDASAVRGCTCARTQVALAGPAMAGWIREAGLAAVFCAASMWKNVVCPTPRLSDGEFRAISIEGIVRHLYPRQTEVAALAGGSGVALAVALAYWFKMAVCS